MLCPSSISQPPPGAQENVRLLSSFGTGHEADGGLISSPEPSEPPEPARPPEPAEPAGSPPVAVAVAVAAGGAGVPARDEEATHNQDARGRYKSRGRVSRTAREAGSKEELRRESSLDSTRPCRQPGKKKKARLEHERSRRCGQTIARYLSSKGAAGARGAHRRASF